MHPRLLQVLVMVVSMMLANGAVYIQPAAVHPEQPDKCFNQLTQRYMLPNKEYKNKGFCAIMMCDNTMTIQIETCPLVEMPGCEELPSDVSWSFPKCCPRFKCVDHKTGKMFIMSA